MKQDLCDHLVRVPVVLFFYLQHQFLVCYLDWWGSTLVETFALCILCSRNSI